MRKPFVAGNWKMNTDSHSSVELAGAIASAANQIAGQSVDVALCPPLVYLRSVKDALDASNVSLGAQNVYHEDKGAFTGETSCQMLKDIGCTYVIIGHSERRHIMGETDEMINRKIKAAICGGLLPIFCVGELLEEREANKTDAVLTRQVKAGLAGLTAGKIAAITIAYEPVWAIGTGKTATTQQAQQAHEFIRNLLSEMYDADLAEQIRIQYGGSVKPDNAAELMAQKDVDGSLVGGASLKADDFVAIIEAAVQK